VTDPGDFDAATIVATLNQYGVHYVELPLAA
jgi:hypothetical protein